MSKRVINDYKKLSKKVINNLETLAAIKVVYSIIPNVSDDLLDTIVNVAKKCSDYDYNSKSDLIYNAKGNLEKYAEYLSRNVFKYDITKEILKNIPISTLAFKFHTYEDINDIIKFNIKDMDLFLRTKDKKYYLGNKEGFYVTNLKGFLLSEPSKEEPLNVLFKKILTQELVYIPYKSHFDIRFMIKNEIIGDKKLEAKYKDGIENYNEYCRERCITGRDIVRNVPFIRLRDVTINGWDSEYTNKNKLFKLNLCLNNLKKEDIGKYEYVASLDNGVDYYYCNDKYIAIDENLVSKTFEYDSEFLLNELKKKHKFVFLADSEIEKISNVIVNAMEDNSPLLKNKYSINEFANYIVNKQIKFEDQKDLNLKKVVLFAHINKEYKNYIKQRNEITKEIKNNKNVEMSLS